MSGRLLFAASALSVGALSFACGSTSTEGGEPVAVADSGADASALGDDDDAGGGADASADANTGFTPAAHTPFPDVAKHANVVLANPHLVTITFPGYAHRAKVDALSAYMGTSAWASAVGAEYGIGAGTHDEVHIAAALPSPLSDAELQQFIADEIASNVLPATGADPAKKPIYMVFIPASTKLTDQGQDDVCGNSGAVGYHGTGTGASPADGGADAGAATTFAYAVVGDCQTGVDDVTSTAAHEYIEAATDPYDPPADGYYMDRPLPDPWYASFDELADLCQYENLITMDGFALQRSWSLAAAKTNGSPCVPAVPGEVYVNTTSSPADVQTVAAGGSFTFTMTGWSSAPTAPWALSTYAGDYVDFDPQAVLSGATVENGGTVTVTLTVPATAKSGDFGAVYVVSGDFDHRWPVGVQAQ